MQDFGLSAYSGAHKAKGALGSFLKAIEAGAIQPGSILIVESLDRLSRQEITSAVGLFMSIIDADITIHTLMDGQTYSKDGINANPVQIVMSIMVMMRSHDESKAKADRLSKVWKAKRDNLGKRKLTAMAPKWLKLNRKSQIFEPIPERVETLQRIFQECLDGYGAYRITKRLNNDGVPTFGRSPKWGTSTVKKILHNRSVLGEFQPHRLITDGAKKTRVPEGEPIADYFPRIIDDSTFYAAQKRLSEKTGKGGRTGFVRNLFQHLAVCGLCGGKVHFVNKGKWQYLRCGDSYAGRGCKAVPWPYQDFESVFLNECRELDANTVLKNGNERANRIKAAQQAVDATRGELAAIEKRIANYDAAIDTADSQAIIDRFVKKLTDAEGQKTDAEKRLSDAIAALHASQSETITVDEHMQSLRDLIRKLEMVEGKDQIQLRDQLRNTIAGLVDKIEFFPGGLQDRILTGDAITGHQWESINDMIADWENIGPDPAIFKSRAEYDSVIGELASYTAQNSGKENRAFLIHFKAGGYRLIKREGQRYVNTVSTLEAILKHSAQKAPGQ
jgi:DNA invertase Pin-like site-specific DNA recombinase